MAMPKPKPNGICVHRHGSFRAAHRRTRQRSGTAQLAITRGVRITADDRLRRDVITQLMCNLTLRFDEFDAAYGIRFAETFAPELERLRSFERDGLVKVSAGKVDVQMAGRMLVRIIAMVFDRYWDSRLSNDFPARCDRFAAV